MNLTEVFGHGIETRTFDGEIQDPCAIIFQVVAQGHIAWLRVARPGLRQKEREALARAQRAEALHLHALAEKEYIACTSN